MRNQHAIPLNECVNRLWPSPIVSPSSWPIGSATTSGRWGRPAAAATAAAEAASVVVPPAGAGEEEEEAVEVVEVVVAVAIVVRRPALPEPGR